MSRRLTRALPAVAVAAVVLAPLGAASAQADHARVTVRSPATSSVTRVDPTVVPPRLKGKVWTRLPTQRKVVALTFDCGAGAGGMRSILSTLKSKGVTRATFFMTGTWVGLFPKMAQRVAKLGYTIGSHSMTHPDFTTLTAKGVAGELSRAEKAITSTTGVSPRPWFRFPYGAYNGRTLKQVNGLGWVAIGWTVDSLGWEGTSGGQSVGSVVTRVTHASVPGEIVLMHVGANPQDHSTLDADALPSIIARLRHKGYHFVSIASLLR